MILISMLAVLAQSQNRFTFDTTVHFEGQHEDGGLVHYVEHDAQTDCTLYLRHGQFQGRITINGATAQSGVEFMTNWQTEHWNSVEFPDSYTVSTSRKTWFWTTCDDGVLLDQMKLYASDGTKSWGSNDEYAWCMSTDSSDGDRFNSQPGASWFIGFDEWDPVLSSFGCYRALLLKPNGQVRGWTGSKYESAGSARRALDDIPTAADVKACEKDEDKTDEDCLDLVAKIFELLESNEEGFQPAIKLPKFGNQEQDYQETEEQSESQEGGSRRLLDLLQKFQ